MIEAREVQHNGRDRCNIDGGYYSPSKSRRVYCWQIYGKDVVSMAHKVE